jgi:hypothetical protein
MMKTMNQSRRCVRLSSSILRYGAVFVLGAAMITAQSRVGGSSAQTNSNGSGKRQHVATLRSSDSPEGSRVVLSSDQVLNDYEAYRRGDRFYVKIPSAEVPRAEGVRGRGFADVKAQPSGDFTLVSFRLEPGATAHVEQRSNRLDVVITVPGGPSVASNSSLEVPRSVAVPESDRNPNANANKRITSTASNSNAASKNNEPDASPLNSASKPGAMPGASPVSSPTATVPAPTPVQKSLPAVAQTSANQPPPATTSQPRQDRWSQMKERVNYWILLAQLNPIPVATGAGLLLLLLGLFLFQRRRAKANGRVTPSKKSEKATAINDSAASVQPVAESESERVVAPVVPAPLPTPPVAAAPRPKAAGHGREVETPAPVAAASPLPLNDQHRERVMRVAEEAKKVMTGKSYDESIIGSDDGETRQLVGAELLSAIVGRNVLRREFARDAFLKHGYFDDATRDLRIAESEHERTAAARRLGFIHDREATPHLIGALGDPAPDVRRAAVEALMDLRDPAAIAPLNALMHTENDRKVPRTLIKHAIDSCATATPEREVSVAASNYSSATNPEPSSQPIETEREVIEL